MCLQAEGGACEEEESEDVEGPEVSERHLGLRRQGLSCTEQVQKDSIGKRGWALPGRAQGRTHVCPSL